MGFLSSCPDPNSGSPSFEDQESPSEDQESTPSNIAWKLTNEVSEDGKFLNGRFLHIAPTDKSQSALDIFPDFDGQATGKGLLGIEAFVNGDTCFVEVVESGILVWLDGIKEEESVKSISLKRGINYPKWGEVIFERVFDGEMLVQRKDITLYIEEESAEGNKIEKEVKFELKADDGTMTKISHEIQSSQKAKKIVFEDFNGSLNVVNSEGKSTKYVILANKTLEIDLSDTSGSLIFNLSKIARASTAGEGVIASYMPIMLDFEQ